MFFSINIRFKEWIENCKDKILMVFEDKKYKNKKLHIYFNIDKKQTKLYNLYLIKLIDGFLT